MASPNLAMQSRHAANYANELLTSLGCNERVVDSSDHPALAWRRSGLLQTTKLMLPLSLAANVDGALMALKALAPRASLPNSGAQLMGERSRLSKTLRQCRKSAGGYGRLLDTVDGRIALNLVRDDDWDLIPAWLEDDITDWEGITDHVKTRETDSLVLRATEIGLAVSKDDLPPIPATWYSAAHLVKGELTNEPLIVDLSSLWAGPLASSLLQMTGARIIKIEGPNRCLLYTSPSPRDATLSRMPSSA